MINGAASRKKKETPRHIIEPVPGEPGRFYVDSRSEKLERAYIVEPAAVEDTNVGKVVGICPCKGWSIHKHCSHVDDARDYAENPKQYERDRKRKSAAVMKLRRPRAVSR